MRWPSPLEMMRTGGLGIAAMSYVAVDYLRHISPSWHERLQPALWSILALIVIIRVPFYKHWSSELRVALPFLASMIFMLAACLFEVLSVRSITAVLGLDWHRYHTIALKDTGQRGIIDRGWGDLGNLPEVPDNVFLLEDCPHDWLFPQCSAVIHHGGAGTTATGLKAGCPTTIVPFFGDQFFWGDRVHEKGLGPAPIPIFQLSVENLSNAITVMLQPEVKDQAIELAKLIENEDGVAAAVDAFHRHLPSEMRSLLHIRTKMISQTLCNGYSFKLRNGALPSL